MSFSGDFNTVKSEKTIHSFINRYALQKLGEGTNSFPIGHYFDKRK